MQWEDLKSQSIWIALKLIPKGQKTDKLPVDANGTAVSWKTRSNLSTYDNVAITCAKLGQAVPGLVLHESLNLVAIDADVHPRYTKNITEIQSKWNTYCEASPSGAFHAFVTCNTPGFIGKTNKKVGLEIYNHDRLISVTFNALNDFPILEVSEEELQTWVYSAFESPLEYRGGKVEVSEDELDKQLAVLEYNEAALPPLDKVMEACKRNERFRKAWDCEFSSSRSEEDASLALWAYIANWPLQEIVDLMIAHNIRAKERGHVIVNVETKSRNYYIKTLKGVILRDREQMRSIQKYSVSQVMTLPDVEWVVPDFIQKDGFTLLWGDKSSFKTFFVLDMCLRASLGLPFFDRPTTQANVLFVFGEGKSGLRKRIEAWFKIFGPEYGVTYEDAKMYLMPIQHDLGEVGQRDQFLRFITNEASSSGIVVFDTLARCFTGFDENDTKDMGRIIKVGDEIRQMGSSVVFVHHSGKDLLRGARGSVALGQAVDISYHLARVRRKGIPTYYKAVNDKSKDGEEIDDLFFRPDIIDLGRIDNLGGPVSSCIIKEYTPGRQSLGDYKINSGQIQSLSPKNAVQTEAHRKVAADAERLQSFLLANPGARVTEIRAELGLNGSRYAAARDWLSKRD